MPLSYVAVWAVIVGIIVAGNELRSYGWDALLSVGSIVEIVTAAVIGGAFWGWVFWRWLGLHKQFPRL